MDWVFHTADRKGEIDLDVTRELPSFTDAAPNSTKRRTGNSSIDGVGELPGDLGQTETGVQNSIQAIPSINDRGDVNHLAVRTGDTILVQEDLPVLVVLFVDRHLSDGDLRHLCDVFEAGDEFADGDVSRIKVRGVIRPAKQCGDVIGRGSVGEEDTVQD